MNNIVFTPSALIELLASIDELSEYDIGLTEDSDGDITLNIGESSYSVDSKNAIDVEVDEAAVDQVDDINQDAYETLSEELDIDYPEAEEIEAGIIKETAKTLLLGGLVRLTTKLLK